MLPPNQFQVSEAWIVFKLNESVIHIEMDGDFSLFALMDAASCYLMSTTTVSAKATEPSQLESRRLLKEAEASKNCLPVTLFIPTLQAASFLTTEAARQGIQVIRVPEDQLLIFIGDAREGFRERFGGSIDGDDGH